MNLCPACKKLMFRTDPCKGGGIECGRTDGGAKKSTAARKDVHKLGGSTTLGEREKKRSGDTGNALVVDGLSDASKVAEISRRVSAGTQALPVDTQKRKRGRPPTGFDKKAHDRIKSAERRAAQKAKP